MLIITQLVHFIICNVWAPLKNHTTSRKFIFIKFPILNLILYGGICFRETSRGRRGSDSSIDDDIDDDDDTFQILTAESLFSTLLSRVRVSLNCNGVWTWSD
jgi:hypothetical protein